MCSPAMRWACAPRCSSSRRRHALRPRARAAASTARRRRAIRSHAMGAEPKPAGEFERIARYFAPLARGFPGAFGLRDDAAVIAPLPGRELVAKTDAIVGGVHFLLDDAPE